MPGNPWFDEIVESVRQDGIREPITMNLQWTVTDGMHRLYAARLLGIETVEVKVWTGTEFVS